MKIRNIKFEDHSIFGDLEIDFTDKDGKTVNTIIIAGENGVGKSILLNSIFDFSILRLDDKKEETHIFEIQFSDEEIEILKQNPIIRTRFNTTFKDNIFKIVVNYRLSNNYNRFNITGKTNTGYSPVMDSSIFGQPEMRKILSSIFSDVEINFTPNEIKNVTSTNIDKENQQSQKSNTKLATEITQLLIDVQSIDALEFTEWARKNIGQPVDNDKIDTRIKRFTTAFDFMFPLKRYKKIENVGNKKEVIFEENGNQMPISQLSSGEKQIVFRGSFLLKDKESSKGALILIDEPEISLHPNWQLKVLNYFKKLFTNNDGEQTSQIIISTHSPFIIHNAKRNEDKVIILQKDEQGKTILADEPKFFTWSAEQIIQEAFSITHVLSINKTTVFLEGETDEKYYNKCLEISEHKESPIEFKWIGRINDKGNAENTGDTALNQANIFFKANMEQVKNKIILFYDSDTNKQDENFGGLLFTKKMQINTGNSTFKKGVENLLALIPEINISDFYKQRTKTDDYGAESIIRELDKVKLCNFICDELSSDKQKLVFTNLKLEIERLLEV